MFQKKNKKWLLGVLTLVLFVPSLALARTIETELGGVVSFNEFYC
jgi:hypothetical protein